MSQRFGTQGAPQAVPTISAAMTPEQEAHAKQVARAQLALAILERTTQADGDAKCRGAALAELELQLTVDLRPEIEQKMAVAG